MIEAYIALVCILKALDMLTSTELHIHRINVLKAQHWLEPTTTIVTGRENGNVSRGNLFNNVALFFGAVITLLLIGWMVFSCMKRRSTSWWNSYQMDEGDLLDDNEEGMQALDHFHVGKIVDLEGRHRTDIRAFEEECSSSQISTMEDDEDDYEEDQTMEDNEYSEEEQTMEDGEDSEEDETMEDFEEEETVEDDKDSKEDDIAMEGDEEDSEEEEKEMASDDEDYEEEEEEKAEDNNDHNEFLEILGQFINDPSAPIEFPRPPLLRDPRRNYVYEAVLTMREKMDRLARENEKLDKEQLDRLNITEELQINNEMEWQMYKSKEDVEDLKETDIEKDNIDQLLTEKVKMEKTVDALEKEVESLVKDNKGPSEVHGGTDGPKLQRIIDRQADQIKRLRKQLQEMEEERRRRELDLQEWEKAVHAVRKENSQLNVALEDLDRKKRLFTMFEGRNKVLEGEVKELKREMVNNERKKEKEERSILKEIETLRTQMTEALTVRDEIRKEKESMALQILKLERENEDCKKDVAYFEDWFTKDYTNHCGNVEDCLGKLLEISDRHQVLLKEKLQLMKNTRDFDEV
ncbi:golgin subfamily A member 6-like protein 24 [Macrobrachium rosenbergii]|uniref:golgin subfamily A member 6-like protein 24 n=1 Tax=Macrobrachium rosenbergii TaxID=79674 RepID=UPI0034D6C3E8